MATDQFSCPECGARLRRSPHLRPGVRVQCPSCKTQFAVPDELDEPAPAPPPPPPPPRRSTYDEDVEGDSPRHSVTRRDEVPPPRRERLESASSRNEDDEDYDRRSYRPDDSEIPSRVHVDMGQWMGYAKQHWGQFLGPAVGFIAVYAVIYFPLAWILGAAMTFMVMAANLPIELLTICQQILGALLSILVAGPLYAGMTAVCLAQLQGRRWSFGDFFAGFRHFASVAGLSAINYLLLAPIYLVQIGTQLYFGFGGRFGGGPLGMGGGEEMFLALAVQLAWLAVYLFLYVRLMVFALPLIFDRGLGPIEAVKASWKMTEGNTFPLLGVVIVLGLINFAGALPCGIGLLFTLPFTGLAYAAGYLLAVGRRPVSLEYHDEDYGPRRRYDEDDRPRRDDYDRPRRRDDDDDYDDRRRGDYRRGE